MAKQKLTIKQEAFCREAVAGLNATEAAKKVYNLGSLKGSGTPELLDQTARAIASENLTKPNIQRRLNELLAELKIDKQSRLKRLAEIFYDEDKRSALGANDQITKILGEYKEQDSKIVGLFAKIESISMTPEESAAEIERERLKGEDRHL